MFTESTVVPSYKFNLEEKIAQLNKSNQIEKQDLPDQTSQHYLTPSQIKEDMFIQIPPEKIQSDFKSETVQISHTIQDSASLENLPEILLTSNVDMPQSMQNVPPRISYTEHTKYEIPSSHPHQTETTKIVEDPSTPL